LVLIHNSTVNVPVLPPLFWIHIFVVRREREKDNVKFKKRRKREVSFLIKCNKHVYFLYLSGDIFISNYELNVSLNLFGDRGE
jgi:hypothetical protein